MAGHPRQSRNWLGWWRYRWSAYFVADALLHDDGDDQNQATHTDVYLGAVEY